MPTFCYQETNPPVGGVNSPADPPWAECDSGFQTARYWVCVDTDAESCVADGPYYYSGDYIFDHAGWTSATGLDWTLVSNETFVTGVAAPGGGEGGSFPELSQADIALLAGKVLLIFAVVFSIRIVYGLIMNRR